MARRAKVKNYKEPTNQDKSDSIIRVVSRQVPDDSYARLMFAIFRQAAIDLTLDSCSELEKYTSERYLRDPYHLEYCGIDPEWATGLFVKCGLLSA